MKNLVILAAMLACLFGPTAIFTLIGYKALQQISKRPSGSANVMISLITKLVITTVILMGLQMVLLRSFAVAFSQTDQQTLADKIQQKKEDKISFHLVDLRIEADYGKGHLPGAVNVPLKKLSFVAEKMFDPKEEVIFYGYSKNDNASTNALILMQNKGYANVSLLEGGIKEWKGQVE